MRIFFLSLFSLIGMSGGIVWSAPIPPTQTVWITESSAKAGEAIVVHAFVYNQSTETVTTTVVFETDTGNAIGKTNIQIPPESARTALAPWKMPNVSTNIIARVSTAWDSKKKEVPEIIGNIGYITIGKNEIPESAPTSFTDKLRLWWKTTFTGTENFRLAQASYFRTLRDDARADIQGTPKLSGEETSLDPLPEKEETAPAPLPEERQNIFLSYALLIGTTIAAGFFANELFFYLGSFVILFLILRFFYRRFI